MLGDAVEQAAKRQRQPGHSTVRIAHCPTARSAKKKTRAPAARPTVGARARPLRTRRGQLECDTRDQRAGAPNPRTSPSALAFHVRVTPSTAPMRSDEAEAAPQKRLAPIPGLRANRRLPPPDSSGSARYVGRMSAVRGRSRASQDRVAPRHPPRLKVPRLDPLRCRPRCEPCPRCAHSRSVYACRFKGFHVTDPIRLERSTTGLHVSGCVATELTSFRGFGREPFQTRAIGGFGRECTSRRAGAARSRPEIRRDHEDSMALKATRARRPADTRPAATRAG